MFSLLLLGRLFGRIAGNEQGLCDGGFYTQRFFKTAIAKPVLYEVSTYLAGCPIGILNRKTKRKKSVGKIK